MDAGSEHELRWLKVEIDPRIFHARSLSLPEPHSQVGFIWRLVFAEAYVAVDAEYGMLHVAIRIFGCINKLDNFELKQKILPMDKFEKVILDITNVGFLDSGFIGLISELNHRNPGAAQKIKIVNPNQSIIEIFNLTMLDLLCEISIDEAVEPVNIDINKGDGNDV